MNTETTCKSAGETEDHFHDTRLLLRQYRQISYAVKLSEKDLGDRTEKEHRIRMSVLEINAALAGIDLSGSKLESYTKSICRSRSMLRIIENALELVRMDPDNGELLYQILYLIYELILLIISYHFLHNFSRSIHDLYLFLHNFRFDPENNT